MAIPIHGPGGELRGVVGIAFLGQRDMEQSELDRLAEAAERAPIF